MASIPGILLAFGLSFGGPALSEEPAASIGNIIEAAKTKADHEGIAAYYEQEAKTAQAKSDEHLQQAAKYKKPGYGNIATTLIQHCNYIAGKYKEIAHESLKMAKMHRDLGAKMKE